jgi:hypothetical protein
MALKRGNGHLIGAYLEALGRYQSSIGLGSLGEAYRELGACFRAWALHEGDLASLLFSCGQVLSGAVLVDDAQDDTLTRGKVLAVEVADGTK